MSSSNESLDQVAELMREARRALFITGAGVSADSGLPTYRGIGGLYNDIETEDGVAIEEALSGFMLQSRPELVWKYIHQIEAACRGAKPNRAHEIIARLEQRLEHVCVLTQNVDGFHRAAGSQNVIDIHGDIHDLLCTSCEHQARVDDYSGVEPEPRCPVCAEFLRPDVVLFGEMLPMQKVARLQAELQGGFDVVFSVGTSSGFPYIAGPVVEARMAGIPTVEINPGETEVSNVVSVKWGEGAAAAFEALWERMADA